MCLTIIAIVTLTQQGGASWESKWESFLAGTSAKELPTCTELKYLIRGGIPYQYKVRMGQGHLEYQGPQDYIVML